MTDKVNDAITDAVTRANAKQPSESPAGLPGISHHLHAPSIGMETERAIADQRRREMLLRAAGGGAHLHLGPIDALPIDVEGNEAVRRLLDDLGRNGPPRR